MGGKGKKINPGAPINRDSKKRIEKMKGKNLLRIPRTMH